MHSSHGVLQTGSGCAVGLLAPCSMRNVNELLHTYLNHEACILLRAKTVSLFGKRQVAVELEQDREEQRYDINS